MSNTIRKYKGLEEDMGVASDELMCIKQLDVLVVGIIKNWRRRND